MAEGGSHRFGEGDERQDQGEGTAVPVIAPRFSVARGGVSTAAPLSGDLVLQQAAHAGAHVGSATAGPAPEPPMPAGSDRRADRWWGAGVFAVYSLLAVGVYWNIWSGHPATTTVGGADSYLESWFLAYGAHAVVHGQNPFYTNLVNYPFGVNLLDNASMLALGVVGLPITLAFGALATFNFWITAGLALSAASAYALARRFIRWHPAAFFAGLVYGFSPYMIVESADGHLAVSFAALLPLVFLVLHDILVARRERWVRNGVLLALLLVVEFFISDELLVITVAVFAVTVAAAAVVGHRAVRAAFAGAAKAIGLAAAATAAALAYPVWFALNGAAHIVGPIQPVAEGYRADLLGPFLPDQVERLAPTRVVQISQHFASTVAENGSYLGIPLLVLVAVGVVWLWRDRAVLVVAVAGAGAFILSLGGALAVHSAPTISASGAATGDVPLPEALLYKVPALRNLIPARFSVYVALAAGLVAGIVLDRLRHRLAGRRAGHRARRRWVRWAVPGVLGIAVLVPLVPVAPFTGVASAGIPAYFTRSHPEVPPGSAALVYPYPSEVFPQAQAWQAYAGLPFAIPGGYCLVPGPDGKIAFSHQLSYSRTTPLAQALTDLWQGKPPPETLAWQAALRLQLAALHVRSVVAVPQDSPDPARSLAYLEWLIGRPPTAHQGGTVDWYGLHWPT